MATKSQIFLALLRAPQIILVFPFMITLERSRPRFYAGVPNDSHVVLGHITAIASILWSFLSLYTTFHRRTASVGDDDADSDAGAVGTRERVPFRRAARRVLGPLAHEATFVVLWLASAVTSGKAHSVASMGIAITETILFSISVLAILILAVHLPKRKALGEPLRLRRDSFHSAPEGPTARGAEQAAQKKDVDMEAALRASMDSNYGPVPAYEERALLK